VGLAQKNESVGVIFYKCLCDICADVAVHLHFRVASAAGAIFCHKKGAAATMSCDPWESVSTNQIVERSDQPLLVDNESLDLFLTALKKSTCIERLLLVNCSLSGRAVAMLVDCIMWKPTIRQLDLTGNQIESEQSGCDSLSKMLNHEDCCISWMKLDENQLGSNGGRNLAKGLNRTTFRTNASHLTALSLNECGLGHAGIGHIATALSQRSFLCELFIQENKIRSAGGSYIGDLLRRNYCLVVLDVSDNEIKAYGMQKLIKGLAFHPNLRELGLDGNPGLTEEWVEPIDGRHHAGYEIVHSGMDNQLRYIWDSVTMNPNSLIKELSINRLNTPDEEKFQDAVGRSIWSCLIPPSRLVALSAAGCNLGLTALGWIVLALERNTSLERLDLGNNNIDDAGGNLLYNTVSRRETGVLPPNTTLEELLLDGNRIQQLILTFIRQALVENTMIKEQNGVGKQREGTMNE
jgi:Leucine Rich repeat